MGRKRDLKLGPRYRLLAKLGEGAFGEVFRVRDHLLGQEVALKRFKRSAVSFDIREMLRAEFLLMARLRHRGIPRVFDVSADSDAEPFYTMEYLRGPDLARRLRGKHRGALPEESIPGMVSALLSILGALRHLHARGLLHGDLKPSNILHRNDPPDEDPGADVVLVDFGLNLPRARRGGLSGTLEYLAPEQIRKGALTPLTDLFSLGVVFYEILTGDNPFRGSDPGARAFGPGLQIPRPSSRAPWITPALEEVLLRLLAADPSLRYRTAEEAQRDLLLASGEGAQRASQVLLRDYRFDPGLVGCQGALDRVQEALTRVESSGDGEVLAVPAPAGSGLGRLLRRVRGEVQAAGGLAITCSLRKGSLADRLREALAQIPARSPGGAQAEARLRREFDRSFQEVPPGDPDELARHRQATLERLVRWSGAALRRRVGEGPARRRSIWILEDAQAAGGADADLVRFLAQRGSSLPTLLLLTGEPGPWTESVDAERTVGLAPLTPDEITSVLAANFHGLSDVDRIAQMLHAKVSGNLWLLGRFLDGLVREGVLQCSLTGWQADPAGIADAELPAEPGHAFEKRLQGLAREAREALAAGAALGTSFDLQGVADALERPARSVLPILDALVPDGVLERTSGTLPRFRFPTPAAAARCEKLATGQRLRLLRRRAVRYLERRVEEGEDEHLQRLAELQAHLRHSGRAADLCDAAGRHLRRRLDLEGALRMFRRANDLRKRARLTTPASALQDLAEVGLALGRHRELQQACRTALRRKLPTRREKIRWLTRAGIACQRAGQRAPARRRFEQALAIGNLPGAMPERIEAMSHLAKLLYSEGRFGEADALYEKGVSEAGSLRRDRTPLVLMLTRKGEFHLVQGKPEKAESCFRQALRLARSGRQRKMLTWIHLALGQLLLDRRPGEAIASLEKAAELAREQADVVLGAWAHYNLGIAHTDLGDTARARDSYLLAREGFACGSRWELARTEAQLGNLSRERGEFRLAAAHYERFQELSRGMAPQHPSIRLNRVNRWKLAVLQGAASSVLDEMRALEGEFPVDHPRSHMAYLRLRSDLERQGGRSDDAERLATALSRLAQIHGDRYSRALALASLAALRAEAGSIVDARRMLLESRDEARRLGNRILEADMDFELARLLHAHPELGEDAAPAVERARSLYEKAELRPRLERLREFTMAMNERQGGTESGRTRKELTTLFRASEVIRSYRDLDDLLNRLLDGALELMGAERGSIFLTRGDPRKLELRASRGGDDDLLRDATKISRSILRHALRDARPIYSTNAMLDERFRDNRSVVNYGIRSFICAPLIQPGKALGTIYVDHRQMDNLFRDNDADFLMAFAGFAAAAIDNAMLHGRLRRQVEQLRREAREGWHPGEIVGDSPPMRKVLGLIDRLGPSEATVLVRGESGTGKELVARMLHERSKRREGPFIAVNCAALPAPLVESELFGVVRGAATDVAERPGKFEEASGGTIFLDEIGDLAAEAQAKILRVLQERRVERVGSSRPIPLDIRLVTATHTDLEASMRAGTFREDLYFRLKVVEIAIPPLRERREDIRALVRHYVDRFCRDLSKPPLGISEDALQSYAEHHWPGNVRELKNAVERAVLLADDDWLPPLETFPRPSSDAPRDLQEAFSLGFNERDLKRTYARYVFEQLEGSKSRACQFLEIDFKTLVSRLG